MLMVVFLAGAAGLGWLIARSAPAAGGASPSPARPRATWLVDHPGEVTARDVEHTLRTRGLSTHDVRLVADTARSLRIRPFTMWMFLTAYGVRELAVAVAAEMPHEEMLDCLSDGSLPAFDQLEVFAGLRGLEAALAPPGWDSSLDDLVV